MSLLAAADRLRAERAVALNRCPVGTFRLTLPDDDRDALDDLMVRPNAEMPAKLIVDALAAEGYKLGFDETAMQSHRRSLRGAKGCKCPV